MEDHETMVKKTSKQSMWRGLALACAAGTLFGSSCGSNQLQAVVAGIEAAASELDRTNRSDDISFGNWLMDEIEDL